VPVPSNLELLKLFGNIQGWVNSNPLKINGAALAGELLQ
jgi:hypothetical protein